MAPICKPVAYCGRMTPDGYQPENHQWRDHLCDRDENGRLIGKDPMSIPLHVLTSSGHPRSGVRGVNFRLRIMQGTDIGEMRDGDFGASSLTKIREQICIPCSSGHLAEVRRCPIYDCPVAVSEHINPVAPVNHGGLSCLHLWRPQRVDIPLPPSNMVA